MRTVYDPDPIEWGRGRFAHRNTARWAVALSGNAQRPSRSSHLSVALTRSASELSALDPTVPMDLARTNPSQRCRATESVSHVESFLKHVNAELVMDPPDP